MLAESSGNPRAVSPSGARGLFQLMGPAAQEVNVTDRDNPEESIRGGCEYLARQLANVKIWVSPQPVAQDDLLRFALVSYNAGAAYVRAALREMTLAGVPIDWDHFTKAIPTASVRGRTARVKECLPYALRILPLNP